MAKKNYEELSATVIDFVGGKENVNQLMHCVTRLRFSLKDKSLVKTEMKNIPGTLGWQWNGDQLQIIIGPSVNDVYDAVTEMGGFTKLAAIDENLDADKKGKKSIKELAMSALNYISGSMIPQIELFVAVGMMKIMLMLLEQLSLINPDGTTYMMLSAVVDAGFYFIPIYVGKSAAHKLGANEGLGMLLGAMTMAPAIMEAMDAGVALNLFGLPVYNAYYGYLMFPALLAVAVMAPIEKFFNRVIPPMFKTVFPPFLTLLVMTPLTFCVLAPAGQFIGFYLTNAFGWMQGIFGIFVIPLFGLIYPIMVLTGMHFATSPYTVQMFATYGHEAMVSSIDVLNNLSQGGASLGAAFRTKDKGLKSVGISAGITAIFGGISEPAMYGMNLKYRRPMVCAMLGNFAGGLVVSIMGVTCYIRGGAASIFGIFNFIGPTPANMLWFAVAAAVSIVVSFIAGFISFSDKEKEKIDAQN
ncbi:MAG: PTS transporter subunit EIIC [Traorella sp.]